MFWFEQYRTEADRILEAYKRAGTRGDSFSQAQFSDELYQLLDQHEQKFTVTRDVIAGIIDTDGPQPVLEDALATFDLMISNHKKLVLEFEKLRDSDVFLGVTH